MDEWIYASARSQVAAVRTGRVSSQALVEAHLARIAAVNPRLNALVQACEARARAEAAQADQALARGETLGPLHGLPITLKDNLDTEGLISTGGTLGRRNHVPRTDATVVARLRQAGAIVLGKTNTPELTYALETDNLVYGRTNNPYDLERSSGGSSGGAAALIAAGGTPFDIGSDTGGSIRVPAHFCGIAGLRPTSGRTPRTGHILPFGGHLDFLTQLGPMARYVEDLELVLPLIVGPDGHDPAVVPMPLKSSSDVSLRGLRVAFHIDNGVLTPETDIQTAVLVAAQALEAAGARVVEVRPPALPQTAEIFFALFYADGCYGVEQLLLGYGTDTPHPWLAAFIDSAHAKALSGSDFAALMLRWDAYRQSMHEFMQDHDLILCPPCAHTAILHDTWHREDVVLGFSYTQSYNLCGWPALVLRCATTAAGLPVGVQLVAGPWQEHVVLAAGAHLEGAFGGWQAPKL